MLRFICNLSLVSFFLILSGCGGDSNTSDSQVPITPRTDKPNIIVFFTDDQGWSDVGYHNVVSDIKTPNIDALAQSGARFTNGYVTAPQCSPSRAAIHTGQYQQRFGMDENVFVPLPLSTTTIAQRFQSVGYTTGMVGKWHLDINRLSLEWVAKNYPALDTSNFSSDQIPADIRQQYFPSSRGYDYVYSGTIGRFWRNFELTGKDATLGYKSNSDYRVDVVSDAAAAFIRKNAASPFYLHIAHFGPHVPIEGPEKYLSQFDANMPVRRRYALATIKAVDDGVGKVLATLNELNLRENTLIVFISDNGAPLGIDKTDAPITNMQEQWNGSENAPMRGEKGMLTEGGIKVPYLLSMPGRIPQNIVIDQAVISLDALSTGLKLASPSYALDELDGIDLMPSLVDSADYLEQRALYWRFQGQQAIRKGKWKYLEADDRKYLFDMTDVDPEASNLIEVFPDIATQLNAEYKTWSLGLQRPDDTSQVSRKMKTQFDIHLNPNSVP